MNIYIRKATEADAKILAAISRQAFDESFAADNDPEDMRMYLDENFTVPKLLKEINMPDTVFYLLFDGDTLAGYAKTGMTTPPEELEDKHCMELERLYVLKPWQDKKLGLRLMMLCIDNAREEGCDTMWLGVWGQNPKAIHFYKKLGFKKFGEHLFQLGTDAQTDWLMRLDL